MQNYRLKIAYDGTRYLGWEHQPGRETIQGKIEQALARMCGLKASAEDFMGPDAPIKLIGAGRTDAGVHARGMVASLVLEAPPYHPGPWEYREEERTELLRIRMTGGEASSDRKMTGGEAPPDRKMTGGEAPSDRKMTCREMQDYLNHYLPDDISVVDWKEAAPRFHARYKATGKTYRYTAFDGRVKPVFNRRYYTPLDQVLDVGAMQAAADGLVGEHDFKSFCGNSRMKKSTVRVVDRIEIRRSKGYVYFIFHGNGFLQNMVRILVGTLMEVGRGRLRPEEMARILEAKDRRLAGPTAPARGLCLMQVDYD